MTPLTPSLSPAGRGESEGAHVKEMNLMAANDANKANKHLFGMIRITIELRTNKGTPSLSLMGRGDFSRPDFGRLKPPLPQT